jgi:hypothetical protein
MNTGVAAKPVTAQQFYLTIGVVYIWLDLLAIDQLGAGWWHIVVTALLLVMGFGYIAAGWRAGRAV